MRPFGAVLEDRFTDLCTRCDACANACPEEVIGIDSDGFPFIDPQLGACTQCGLCTTSCETGALKTGEPWLWKARTKSTCLSRTGVQCRTCEDFCDQRAIRFRPQTGGRAEARVDSALCIGCGSCAGACPIGAIELYQTTPQPEAKPC